MNVTLSQFEQDIFLSLYKEYIANTEPTPTETFEEWFDNLVRHQIVKPSVDRFVVNENSDRISKLFRATAEELKEIDAILDKESSITRR